MQFGSAWNSFDARLGKVQSNAQKAYCFAASYACPRTCNLRVEERSESSLSQLAIPLKFWDCMTMIHNYSTGRKQTCIFCLLGSVKQWSGMDHFFWAHVPVVVHRSIRAQHVPQFAGWISWWHDGKMPCQFTGVYLLWYYYVDVFFFSGQIPQCRAHPRK